jgi:hypothetical protein
MPASEAQTKLRPLRAERKAFFATVGARQNLMNLAEMLATVDHMRLTTNLGFCENIDTSAASKARRSWAQAPCQYRVSIFPRILAPLPIPELHALPLLPDAMTASSFKATNRPFRPGAWLITVSWAP